MFLLFLYVHILNEDKNISNEFWREKDYIIDDPKRIKAYSQSRCGKEHLFKKRTEIVEENKQKIKNIKENFVQKNMKKKNKRAFSMSCFILKFEISNAMQTSDKETLI